MLLLQKLKDTTAHRSSRDNHIINYQQTLENSLLHNINMIRQISHNYAVPYIQAIFLRSYKQNIYYVNIYHRNNFQPEFPTDQNTRERTKDRIYHVKAQINLSLFGLTNL